MKTFLVGQMISLTMLTGSFGLMAAADVQIDFLTALLLGVTCGIVGMVIAVKVLD